MFNMNLVFLLVVLIIGFSGLVAQVLLLRELLVSFYGNELTIGVILANWMILEALGVFIIGRFIDRVRNKTNVFAVLQMIFSSMLPVSIYFSRTFKGTLGIPFGEGISLSTIFYASFLILLPIGFCHGALFASASKLYSLRISEPSRSIGRVYGWETIGTIIGGIIITYLFIPLLNSFQAVFIVSVINVIACLFFFKDVTKILKYVILFSIFIIVYLHLSGFVDYLHRISIARQWKTQQVLDYRNSIYGNITVTRKQEQYTFFYNGLPTITTPYPDITFVQEFGNLPLLFHPDPKNILVISQGAGGLINEILKHPVTSVDYAELDPLIIKTLQRYPTMLTQKELTERRVNIVNMDGRFFIRNTSRKYDVVLIGLSEPQDLSTNRLFTQRFFYLVGKRLNQEGILAFCLPGSLTYLSKELKDLNACILNALKDNYDYVRIVPGDYNIFLASGFKGIEEADAVLISQRIIQRNIKTDVLIPSYLDFRLNKYWLDWFMRNLSGATEKINQDFKPFAVFKMLVLWNKKFSPGLTYILDTLENLDLSKISIFIFLASFLLFYILYLTGRKKLTIAYSIATTGFFGMLSNLILIFSFQVYYGYLYYRIGILTSIFMSGIALGSIFMTAHAGRVKNKFRLFIGLEILIIGFSYIMALTTTKFLWSMHLASLVFGVLFFASGLLIGIEFPLASKIYIEEKGKVGITVGVLYGSDLMGGWVAGVLGGILLLPVLGIFNACVVMILFKISSLFLLVAGKK